MISTRSPFHLDADAAYQIWREAKLSNYPTRAEDMVVEVGDPRALTPAEHDAILRRCRKTNLAIYASRCGTAPDKDIPRKLGLQFGLKHLDHNLLADEDAITSLTVAAGGGQRGDFIPYTDRPIRWHTDGYYNPPRRRILGLMLHCVTPAVSGGANALLDHEIAYLLIRDANPEHIRALMAPDAMTIPARMDENGVARPAETGPVFSVLDNGQLHMRYTARTRSIEWHPRPATLAAAAFLEQLLASELPYIFRARLESGMGLVCNNVLHDRSGFSDDETQRRLLYRARYYERMANT